MCRWMAWHGQPILIEELLFKTKHGLIDQSLHSKLGAETTNGDGNGVGWYGTGGEPGRVSQHLPRLGGREPAPPCGPHRNAALPRARPRELRNGGPAEQLPPLLPRTWLFVHNGLVNEFHAVRRELMLALDAQSVGEIEGSADSEVLFHLALGFGLEDDPLAALELAVGFVEQTLARQRDPTGPPGQHRRQRRRTAVGGSLLQ